MLCLPTAPIVAETHDVIGSGYTRSDNGTGTMIGTASGPPVGVRNDPLDVAGRAVGTVADRETDGLRYFHMRLGADTARGDQRFLNSPLRLIDPAAANAAPPATTNTDTGPLDADASARNGFIVEASPTEPRDGARSPPSARMTPKAGTVVDSPRSSGARAEIGGAPRTGSMDLRSTTFLDFAFSWRYRDLDMDLHRDARSRSLDR